MAEFIEIHGGVPLRGTVAVSGAKNASLPLLIASLLTSERCTFTNIPNIEDIHLLLRLLEQLGAETEYDCDRVSVKVAKLNATEASYSLVKALRASFWVLAPLLARGRAARVALPGGDIIGARPVDLHISGLTAMGAEITVKHGVVLATAVNGLRPATIDLRFPSVGATHQLLMAMALTPGTSVLRGAAREPEIVALADFLNTLGADIEGQGSSEIVVRGKEELHGGEVRVIGDRIEAATYLLAGAAAGGAVKVTGIKPQFFGSFLGTLEELGLEVSAGENEISIVRRGALRPVKIRTGPFPEFATDIQAPLIAALTVAAGESEVEENIFEGRFAHVSELCRMGAKISITERTAHIVGVPTLTGAAVEANDIRAAAALIIAGLAAEGRTQLHEPRHLRRGYDALETKLGALGARIQAREADSEDFLFTGC